MRHAIRLSAQEQYLRGETALERWEHAQQLGLMPSSCAAGEGRFAARLPELKHAAAAGVPMPTVCVDMRHFVGDFDADKRADALIQMKSQLSVIAEVGGQAMTPASYGMFSKRLPPFESTYRGRRRRDLARCIRSAGRPRRSGGCDHRAGAAESVREPHDQHLGRCGVAVRKDLVAASASRPTPTT